MPLHSVRADGYCPCLVTEPALNSRAEFAPVGQWKSTEIKELEIKEPGVDRGSWGISEVFTGAWRGFELPIGAGSCAPRATAKPGVSKGDI